MFNSWIIFENTKATGNDGLSKEFSCTICNNIKDIFLTCWNNQNNLNKYLFQNDNELLKFL